MHLQPSMSGQRTSLHRESDPFHRFRILNSEFSAKAWGSLFLSLHNQGNRSWGQEPACELWKSLNFAACGKYYESANKVILMPDKWLLHKVLCSPISLAGSFTFPLVLGHNKSKIRSLRWACTENCYKCIYLAFYSQRVLISDSGLTQNILNCYCSH